MIPLIRKEVREQAALTALGLVVFSILLVQVAQDARHGFQRLYPWTLYQIEHPLLSSGFRLTSACFCLVFGAALGWFQMHREHARDLRAFLLHRPVRPERVFLAKVLAGSGLYTVAVGVPLVVYALWSRWPGHVPLPFAWAMTLPSITCVGLGMVAYFTGMLTAARPVRWWGSRGLGLGLALVVTALAYACREFSQAVACVTVAGGAAALAAAAAFLHHGAYTGQPAWGKASLTFTLGLGVLVLFVPLTYLLNLVGQMGDDPEGRSFVSYQMLKDGTVCRTIQGGASLRRIEDLQGQPLPQVQGVKPATPSEWPDVFSPETRVKMRRADRSTFRSGYAESRRFFVPFAQHGTSLWLYSPREERLVVYDTSSARCLGSVGPRGFAAETAPSADRFVEPQWSNLGYGVSRWEISTAAAVYRVNPADRSVARLFVPESGDRVTGFESAGPYAQGSTTNFVVVTERAVSLLDNAGKPVWRLPIPRGLPRFQTVRMSALEPGDRWGVWFVPRDSERAEVPTPPTHVVWVGASGAVERELDLPPLARPGAGLDRMTRFLAAVAPPGLHLLLRVVTPWRTEALGPRSLVGAVACALVGWGLTRRYRFGGASQFGWGIWHLVWGIPGLLVFLSVQEWPAREPCPACRRPRRVDRESCDRCGAPFPPPATDGTEIHAPLAATRFCACPERSGTYAVNHVCDDG